jgi:hypothetical protein
MQCNRSLQYSKTIDKTKEGIPESICELVLEFDYKLTTQLKIFNLFIEIKKRICITEYKNKYSNRFYISKSLLIDTLKFNNNNYKVIIDTLMDKGYINKVRLGTGYKGHCTQYEWVGPEFTEGPLYTNFIQYLKDSKKISSYSKYIKNKIIAKELKKIHAL